MGELRIAEWDAAHCRGVIGLISRIQREEYGLPITPEQQPDLTDVPGFYRQGRGNFWVALETGAAARGPGSADEVVGTIALKDIGGDAAALRKMFVRADRRGRGPDGSPGVARSLLAHALDHARAVGLRSLFLGTTPFFLAAHKFYARNGFREIDPAELPPTFPLMHVDTKFFRMDL
ncbi:GCN5-related N-acetyltransferase [Desulfovibrio sp. X2]|uniref:GNAT family N-acetyltransferase n=1 Tax=Desulfovibrio sp. X2 TaxID=941449 RepID=UPI000358BEAA|nr:GNAT family N-acetyltransferase [Desulfovibrio sp. X2]EPR44546.1 GCN5-related N-acetyltransferase [Desulfovibrio sp. X2]